MASRDLALFHALRMKRAAPEEVLRQRLAAAEARGVPLEEVLRVFRDVDPATLARAVEALARHARRCSACAEVTYLQPGQTGATTPCERCGGALLPRSTR